MKNKKFKKRIKRRDRVVRDMLHAQKCAQQIREFTGQIGQEDKILEILQDDEMDKIQAPPKPPKNKVVEDEGPASLAFIVYFTVVCLAIIGYVILRVRL